VGLEWQQKRHAAEREGRARGERRGGRHDGEVSDSLKKQDKTRQLGDLIQKESLEV